MKLELHDDQIFVDADEEVSSILQQYNYLLFSGTSVQEATLFVLHFNVCTLHDCSIIVVK